MKTYKSLIAVLAVGAFASMAVATEVHSVNIVGYQKVDITGGTFNMLAVNWDSTGTNETINIQDLLDTSALTGGENITESDIIYVWNPATSVYDKYWLYDSGGAWPTWDNKWLIQSGAEVADVDFSKGDAYWLLSRGVSDTNFNIVGQVPMVSTDPKWIYAGTFNMIGSSFAADLPLNGDFDWIAAGAKGGEDVTESDMIYIWNPDTLGYEKFWLYDSGGAWPTWDGKWLIQSGAEVADVDIKLGQGAWYRSRAVADWQWPEPRPYLND